MGQRPRRGVQAAGVQPVSLMGIELMITKPWCGWTTNRVQRANCSWLPARR